MLFTIVKKIRKERKKQWIYKFIPLYLVYLILFELWVLLDFWLYKYYFFPLFFIGWFIAYSISHEIISYLSYELAYNLKKKNAKIITTIAAIFSPVISLIALEPITLYFFRNFHGFFLIYLFCSILGSLFGTLTFRDGYLDAIIDGKYDSEILKNIENKEIKD